MNEWWGPSSAISLIWEYKRPLKQVLAIICILVLDLYDVPYYSFMDSLCVKKIPNVQRKYYDDDARPLSLESYENSLRNIS
jgi:hypothetical protein